MQTKQTWRALADWVSWLRDRYPLAQKVPTCWWRHPEIVEEMTALWLAWREAYVEKGAPLSGGADWHGRWLPEFLRRVGAGGWNLACEGEHRPIVEDLYEARAVDDQRQFEQFINGSTSGPDATEGARRMDDDTMAEAVATGEGIPLGDLPDAPVKVDDSYWIRDWDGWAQVDSADTIAFLRDAERRMRLADEAVRDSEPS